MRSKGVNKRSLDKCSRLKTKRQVSLLCPAIFQKKKKGQLGHACGSVPNMSCVQQVWYLFGVRAS